MRHLARSLGKHPELARQVGLLMADYAALEYLLFRLFHLLGNESVEEAFSKFFSQRTINRKTELLEQQFWQLPPFLARAFKRIIRRIKSAAQRRTDISHVHYVSTASGPKRIRLINGNADVLDLTEHLLVRTCDQYRTLGEDILLLEAYLVVKLPKLLEGKAKLPDQLLNARIHPEQILSGPAIDRPADATESALKRLGLLDDDLGSSGCIWIPTGSKIKYSVHFNIDSFYQASK